MEIKLYTDVVLLHDLPTEGLRDGDVGTVVEQHRVPNPGIGYSVEFFYMLGNTVAVATTPASYLRVPTLADRPTVRSKFVAA